MLFEGALVAFGVALLLGGRPSRLGQLGFRRPWCFVAGFALQAAIVPLALQGYQIAIRTAGAVHLASFALLFAGLWANRRARPFQVIALGVLLNFLVIAANGGRMPADPKLVAQVRGPRAARLLAEGRVGKHVTLGPHTRLAFLADRYPLPRPYPLPCVFSPGDVVITLGVCWLILAGMGPLGWRTRRPPLPQEAASPAPK